MITNFQCVADHLINPKSDHRPLHSQASNEANSHNYYQGRCGDRQ
ncbi:hypothetical protein C4J92_0183 [Pseudomonas sp. R3-18-08]|nr:hypothetical protein C4J92_0183 [Pseudomonas sp. R3-18-08]